MMTRNKRTQIVIGSIMVGLAIAGSIIALIYLNRQAIKRYVDINIYKRTYVEDTEQTFDHPYMKETTYDGTNEIDLKVFDYPFDKGIGDYRSNRDLYGTYPNAYKKVYSKAKASADAFMTNILGTGYRTLADDEESYEKAMMSVMTTDAIHNVSSSEFISDLKTFVSAGEYQGTVTFISDPSLMWFNDYGYLRGILILDTYNIKEDADASAYPDGLEVKDGSRYIVDLGLVVDDTLTKVRINDIEVIAKVK